MCHSWGFDFAFSLKRPKRIDFASWKYNKNPNLPIRLFLNRDNGSFFPKAWDKYVMLIYIAVISFK